MPSAQITPWKRTIVEAVAVVASILLAFAIDAWWAERGLREEEQQVLQGLREEFISARKVLSGHLSEHLKSLQALEDFLIAAEEGDVKKGAPIVDDVLLELLSPMTSDLGSGTLAALLSSGRIEILTNRALRAKLASWEGVIGEVWDDQALNAKSVFELHIPYFLAENIPAGIAMHQWYEDWSLPRKSPSDDPDMISRLMGDETLRAMVEFRYGYKKHLTSEFEIAIEAVDEILAEIESSIH